MIAGGKPQPSDISENVLDSIKKRKVGFSTQIMNQQDSHPVPLPHLVYKVGFHENEILQHNVWAGTGADDILKNIIDETKNGAPAAQKNDSKVIIVLELPVGGQVSGYNVGDTDDILNVEILKHSLMLNPKALSFSGIQSGILDISTDGPLTARGGIRLAECSKALKNIIQI